MARIEESNPDLPRVFIRHPVASDEAEYLSLRRQSREFLEPWEPLPPEGAGIFCEGGFERFLARSDTDQFKRYLVCIDESPAREAGRGGDASGKKPPRAGPPDQRTGRIVGQVSLGQIVRGPLQQAFMGWAVFKPYSGRGYMTRGVRLVLEHCFRVLKLHRIEANIQPHNAASIALAKRIGFRKEGFSPGYLQIAGAWADHERWAIRAEDMGFDGDALLDNAR